MYPNAAIPRETMETFATGPAVRGHRVPGLVGGHDALRSFTVITRVFFSPATTRVVEVGFPDRLLALAGGEELAPLVHDVRQIRPDEARMSLAIAVRLTSGANRHPLGVHPEDGLAPLEVRPVHQDLAVKPAGGRPGSRISGAVGGCDTR